MGTGFLENNRIIGKGLSQRFAEARRSILLECWFIATEGGMLRIKITEQRYTLSVDLDIHYWLRDTLVVD